MQGGRIVSTLLYPHDTRIGMEWLDSLVATLDSIVWWGPTIGAEKIPLAVIALPTT